VIIYLLPFSPGQVVQGQMFEAETEAEDNFGLGSNQSVLGGLTSLNRNRSSMKWLVWSLGLGLLVLHVASLWTTRFL